MTAPGHTEANDDTARLRFPRRDERAAESTTRALLRCSALQAERILVKWAKDPATLLQSLLFPALMVLLFWLVLDRSVSAHSGSSSVFGMVPMVALVGAMSGSSISGLGLRRERMSGLLSKMWTLPVHRASAMVGRLAAEAVRIVVTVSAVLLVGAVIGFRIHTGVGGALAILAVTVIFGLSFSMMVTALALRSRDSHIVEWVAIGTNLAMFFNTGFVPADAYPAWLQPIVRYQPLSCAVDTIRGFANDVPWGQPLALTLAWSVLLLVAFTGPTLAGYRTAATIRS
ncbi:ABC transporter permease [Gordonia sp. CPCC 206044]|uniref:ABC transporter permease n=1 Tax=Gordonia sp. CPCC 206044 TaxID=3140793 RepID=UPI003AF3996F